MTATTLFLARHGQTQWNAQGRFQGWKDSPLTPLGEQEARMVARFFSHRRLDRVYSSDLGRALFTAQIIRAHHPRVPFSKTRALREINFGALEGRTWAEASDTVPSIFEARDALDVHAPRGESFEDLKRRVSRFLRAHVLPLQGKRVLLVCHDGVIRTLLQILFDLPYDLRAETRVPHHVVYEIRIPPNGGRGLLRAWHHDVRTGAKKSGVYLER